VKQSLKVLGGLALLGLIGCGGQGLAPAGPKPGEVDVGYGTQPKDKVSGAVTSVSGDGVAAVTPLRLEELLKGKSAGLQIVTKADGSQALRIRGGNASLMEGTSEQEPLIVVDGIQIPVNDLASALAGLTPADIKQVDVLKDVASTSIYGLKGAAGVIVISTRRR
jgi:TonB-dependent SusC/RagA subfamily outer membrane receptor